MLLVFLFGMGMHASVVYHTGKRQYSVSQIWTASLVVGGLLSVCAFLAGLAVIPTALRQYPPEVRGLALLLLATAPIIWLGGIPTSFMQGTLNMLAYNTLRAIAPFVFAAGLGILYWLHRASLRDVVLFRILGLVLALASGLYFLLSRMERLWVWDRHACLSLLKFGFKTHLGNMSSYVNRSADQLILSLFVPPQQLGLYAVAVTAAGVVGFLPQAAGMVTIAGGANSSPIQARRIITYSFRVSLLWLIVACCGLFVIAPYAIRLLFGSPFAGSVAACRVLLPGMVAAGLNQVLYEGARAFNHPELPSYTEGFSMIVTVVALCLLLPHFGFLGAAIASTLAYVSSLILMLGFCGSRMQLGPLRLLGLTASPVQVEHAC
jgi:O-antigen/teichoic acid export membrane protein